MDLALSPTSSSMYHPSTLTYERLKFTVNEIRLIVIERLEDSAANNNAVLKCTLEHHILESAPRFFALSYNWGDAEDTEQIYVNGCIFHATRNLYDALKALRAHGRVHVWADAVCINQNDYEERALQLLRMGSIYRAASEVCIWLGLADEDIANALKNSISKAMTEQGRPRYRWFYDEDHPQYSLKQSKDGFIEVEQAFQPEVARYLRSALSRPYWERLWILQEVSLASRIVVFYGHDAVDWHTFIATFIAARLALPEAFSRLETLISLRQDILDNRPPFFFTALCDTYASKATVPRDRLYGLLGVTVDGSRLFPAPSYEQSHAAIFRDLTVQQVLSQKSLDFILLRGQTSLTDSKMPSWVPDWLTVNPSSYEWRIAKHIRAALERKRTLATAERWHASRYTVVDASSLSFHGPKLRLQGHYVATIGSIGPSYGVSFGPLADIQSDANWNAGLCSKSEQMPPWNESSAKVLDRLRELFVYGAADSNYRTTHKGHMYAITDSSIKEILNARDDLLMWWFRNRNIRIANIKLNQWLIRAHQLGPVTTSAAANGRWRAMATSLWRRNPDPTTTIEYLDECLIPTLQLKMRFFSASNGYFGWAHSQAQPNDKIYLLAGCSLPVILRKVDVPHTSKRQRWQVVGDAYVPGLMFGEAFAEKRLEVIELV